MKEYRKIPSLDFRYEISIDGEVRNIKSKKVKKQFITRNGYLRTSYRVNKTNIHFSENGWDRTLHSLVMECWGQKQPSEKHEIDHFDRNKLNNHISNLRWVTRKENYQNQDHSYYNKTSESHRNMENKKRCPVRLVGNGIDVSFNSAFRCAEWLITNNYTDRNVKNVQRNVRQNKNYIYGFSIIR